MSEERDDIELIEAFLNNELDEISMNAFRRRLEEEPELKSDVESFRYAQKSVMNQGLKMKLQEIHDSLPENKSKSSSLNWKWMVGVAASVLIAVFVYVLRPSNLSNDELYATYYVPYKVPDVRGEVDSLQFLNLYRNGEYEKALSLLNNVATLNPTYLLVSANCKIQIGEFEAALSDLRILENDSSDLIVQHASWYSSLILIKIGQEEAAISELKSLSNNTIYSKEASELLTKISD